MTRRLELDAARGLMLIWMTLTHLPTVASVVANQPFGFISGAEGFIFLSGLFCGLIYFRIAQREGYESMRSRLYRRAAKLYGYHALLLGFAFLVVVRLAAHGNRPGLFNLFDFYFAAGPQRAITDAALLLYRPPLLDILPMYIFFLLLTPLVLTVARRTGWKLILGISLVLWINAQLGLRQTAYDFLAAHFGLRIPLNEMGSFDLWAWQMQWVIGLYFGVRWANDDLPVENWARRLAIPAMIIVPVFFALRWAVGNGIELGSFEVCFDKWHLGIVRLVDFAAIAVLLVRFQSAVKPLAARPLVLLGQSSLQVFCSHLFFCFLGLTIMGESPHVTGWQQVILIATTLGGMWITAWLFGKKGPTSRDRMAPPLGAEPQVAVR